MAERARAPVCQTFHFAGRGSNPGHAIWAFFLVQNYVFLLEYKYTGAVEPYATCGGKFRINVIFEFS